MNRNDYFLKVFLGVLLICLLIGNVSSYSITNGDMESTTGWTFVNDSYRPNQNWGYNSTDSYTGLKSMYLYSKGVTGWNLYATQSVNLTGATRLYGWVKVKQDSDSGTTSRMMITSTATGIIWQNMGYANNSWELINASLGGSSLGVTTLMIYVETHGAVTFEAFIDDIGFNMTSAVFEANFTSNVTSAPIYSNVQFNDTSIGSPTYWEWLSVSNDGLETHTSLMQNPNFTFERSGYHSVMLLISKSGGYSDVMMKPQYIYIAPLTDYFEIIPNTTPIYMYAAVKYTLTPLVDIPSGNYIGSIRWYQDTSVSDFDDDLYFVNVSGSWRKYNATYPSSYVSSTYAEAIAPTITAPATGEYVVHAGVFDKDSNLLQIVDYETIVQSSTNQANLQVWVLDLTKSGHSLIPDSTVSVKDEVLNTTANYTTSTGLINIALYQGRYYSISANKTGYNMYNTPMHVVGGGYPSLLYVYLYPTTGVNITRFFIQDLSGNAIDSASIYIENIDNSTASDFSLASNSNGYAYCAPFMGETYQYSVTKEGYIGYTSSFNNLAATTITVTLYKVGEVTTTATPTPIPTTTIVTTVTPVVTITPPPTDEGWVGYIKWIIAKQGVKTSFSQSLLTGVLVVFMCAIVSGGSLALMGAKSAAGFGFIVGGLIGMITAVALDLLPLWFVLVGVLFIGVIAFIMIKD